MSMHIWTVGEKMAKGKYKEWLKPEKLTLVQGWRRDGLSDNQVAKNIGINRSTLYAWLDRYEDFSNAYKKGSEVALYEVENALFKSACGYDVTEAETVTTVTPDGAETKQVRKRLRHIPPNVGAICFILKNRRSDKWRDKQIFALDESGNGQLTALINGLKEENDDIHTETKTVDEPLADEQTEEN